MRPRRNDRESVQRQVLLALSLGTPLAVIARKQGVSPRLVTQWAERDPDGFGQDLADARALGWDSLAHECLEIADDARNDWMVAYDERTGDATGWRFNGENVNRSRLRIETRMRLLRWWDNGRYGEGALAAKRVEVAASLTTTTRHVVDPRLLDADQREALRQLLVVAERQGLVEDQRDLKTSAQLEADDLADQADDLDLDPSDP